MYEIPHTSASKSIFLSNVLEMQDVDQAIPVPFVAREDVAQILYDFFCSDSTTKEQWPPRLCYDVLLAANGMDMPDLLNLCVQEIAARWRFSTQKEIRATWGFDDNLTEEEKGAIQKENSLLEIFDTDTGRDEIDPWTWPPEMLFLILSKLPTRELARVRAVCAELYDCVQRLPGRGDLKVSANNLQTTNVPFVERHCLLETNRIDSLHSLKKLKHLAIKPKSKIGPEGAMSLGTLQNLEKLVIGWGNYIGAEGATALSALQNLKKLEIGYHNDIGAEGAATLSKLQNLTHLMIWAENNIGAAGAAALTSLHNLKELVIGSNNIGAEGATALSALRNLTHLEIWNNNIGAEGATALSALRNLTHLEIWNNNIGAEGATALSTLQNLQHLKIGWDNNIGAEGAAALATLQNLQHLIIESNNNIGTEGIHALSRPTNLQTLKIARDGNQFSKTDEKNLQAVLPGTTINFY